MNATVFIMHYTAYSKEHKGLRAAWSWYSCSHVTVSRMRQLGRLKAALFIAVIVCTCCEVSPLFMN